MNFIYCFNEQIKEKLIMNGYTFISDKQFGNGTVFLFANNGEKLTFTNSEVLYTNKLTF